MPATAETTPGLPDMKVSVRQVFGFDSDLEVPAYSNPDEHVPDLDPDYLFDRQTGQAASKAAATGQTQTERPIRAAEEEMGLEVAVPVT